LTDRFQYEILQESQRLYLHRKVLVLQNLRPLTYHLLQHRHRHLHFRQEDLALPIQLDMFLHHLHRAQ
jgi:hypothetical protein